MLHALTSIVFDGLAYAMMLFIISVGLSITMGLMGFVNLAHGVFAMAGGYVTALLMERAGLPFFACLAVAFAAVALISVPAERFIYAHFYERPELEQVLMSIALVFMAIATCTFLFGPDPLPFQLPPYLKGQVHLGLRSFPTYRFFLICVGFAMIALLVLVFDKTLIGARIRAAVDNRAMAQSVGIDVRRLFTLTFALGSGFAALGGGLAIDVVGLQPTFALQYLVQFLIVVTVGGLGSIRGAFAAALVIGIAENAGKYLWPEGGGFFIYAITVVLLLLKPEGLAGKG
jgi:branched-chain amino acid transport system permease protein